MSQMLSQLFYMSGQELRPLPEWARFFMSLGQQLAAVPRIDRRLVVGLAIPTRAFACGLLATGITYARAGTDRPASARQIQFIRKLPPGTPVHVRTDEGKKLRGVIEEFKTIDGIEYVCIRTARRQVRGFQLDRYASRITVAEGEVSLPETQQTGWTVESPSEFLEACLGTGLAQAYILDSSLEVLITGKLSALRSEICDAPFFYEIPEKLPVIEGSLQDLLRVRQFSGANRSFRVECMASSNSPPEQGIRYLKPPIVAFDGAIAYIKHAFRWPRAHQVVLLDRTERQFSDAVHLLNQTYAYRTDGDPDFRITIPNGIEMMVFAEQLQS